MHRIVVTRRLPASAMRLLARPDVSLIYHDSDEPMPKEALSAAIAGEGGASGVVCLLSDQLGADVLKLSPRLKAISTMSVGYSHIHVPTVVERGMRVGYTPGVLTESTADLVVALTAATARRIPQAAQEAKTGGWTSWKPFWMCGKDLHGATCGIVGMGRIGEAVGKRLRGFDCKLLYTGRSGPKPEVEATTGATFAPLPDLLRQSDFVILLCALTPDTRGLIGAEQLRMMKEDAVLINASRGEVVNQDDLITVLKERPGMMAGLDVTTPEPLPLDNPLLSLPNAVVLPHIGSASTATRTEMARITVQNVIGALGLPGGGDMVAEIPETAAARGAGAAAAAAL